MPKYMIRASYTVDGVKGLLKEGGSGRRAAIEKMVASAGGSLEEMYFAFGKDDVFVIADLPNNEIAAAIALTVGATGTVSTETTVLLAPEEIDAAVKQSVNFRPAGR